MIQPYENETITKTVRRHWFVVAIDIFMFLVFALVPLIGITMFLNNVTVGKDTSSYNAFIAFFYLVWLEFAWIMFTIAWTTNYYLDVVLITNRRLLKIDYRRCA
ncbi:MAG: hypothetical protein HZA36_00605 [Parcubacteria group bacterium]|nr:hypothetical protein [Parcubacteria group bacterium]